MSSAVTGAKRAKNTGSNACTPSGEFTGVAVAGACWAQAVPDSASTLTAMAAIVFQLLTLSPP